MSKELKKKKSQLYNYEPKSHMQYQPKDFFIAFLPFDIYFIYLFFFCKLNV